MTDASPSATAVEVQLNPEDLKDASDGTGAAATLAWHLLDPDGDGDRTRRNMADLLFGRSSRRTRELVAEIDPARGVTDIFLAAVSAHGIDAVSALAVHKLVPDLLALDPEGCQIFASWTGGDGAPHLRIALGSDVHLSNHGDVLLPDLPDTVAQTLRGMRIDAIVDHPLLPRGATVGAVVVRRLWGDRLVRALQLSPLPSGDRP